MTNTMTCAMKREALYLPSNLVLANILCSRCEPLTKLYEKFLYAWSMPLNIYIYNTSDFCRSIEQSKQLLNKEFLIILIWKYW